MLYEQEISLVRLSDGDSGRSSFVHIKYSNDGKTFTTNNGEDIGSWLGIYTDDKEEESTVFSDYKWSKILGATGAVGTGIDSVTKEFYLSNSKTTQSGGSWQTNMPEWSYGKYLWTREKIVYKNPTSTVYTTPSCDSSWEAANVVDKKVTTLQTDFKVEQGKIESLIKETTIDNGDGTTTSLKDAYNQTKSTVEGNKTTIAKIKTSVDDVTGKVTDMESAITEIKQTADGVQTTVTENKAKWDKASSDASSAVSTANKASGNASTALNKATALETKANNGEFDGRGVKSTTVEYQASTSGITAPSGTWSPTVPTVANGSYLWTRTTITYTSGDPSIGYSVARMGVNGAKGDKGETGQTGANGTSVTVKSTAVSYGVSSSASTKPSSFSPTMPTVAQGQYLWTKTVVTYSDGNSTETFTYALQGVNGAKGDKGASGKDGVSPTVTSTKVEYQQSTNGTTAPTGTWSTTTPTANAGQYMWTKTTVTYSDGKTAISYTVSKNGINGAKGDKGLDGKNGVTYYTWIKYADSPTSGMSDSPTNKKYMGIAINKTSSAESTSYSDYTWSLIKGDKGDTGDKGNTGATGNGIASITYTYARTTTQTTPSASSVTSTTMPTLDSTNKYLWQKEIITYTNGQTQTNVVLIAVYGDKGQTGAKGADGKSPTVSVSKSGATTTITVVNADGSKTTQTVNDGTNGTPGKDGATGKTSYFHVKYSNDGGKTFTANNGETVGDYLGTYTDFVEADSNSVAVYTWVKIKGNTGATGSAGKGISSIVHHYLVTNVTTGVTSSTSGWKDTPQSVTATNKYLWYYQTINYTAGTPTNTTPAIIGVYGDTGNKGATGKGISSVTPQYYLSTSNTTQTGGSWKTTQDTWSSGKYYWTRDSIVWSDGTTTTTTPTLATGLNNANSTALSAQTIANQTASKFQWIVKSGNSATDFTLTDRTAQLVADSINLKGLVMFKGLDTSTQGLINSKANQSIIDNWAKDAVVNGETVINGGYIQANTIKLDQLNVKNIFAEGESVMTIINTQKIDAGRITTGQLSANRINAYGLTITDKNTNQQTLDIGTKGEVTVRGSVSSYDYIPKKSGWTINRDGTAEFNDVIARGSVITTDGGIVSSGSSGVNLQKDTSFYNQLNDWSEGSNWSVDNTFIYETTKTAKFSRTGLTSDSVQYLYSGNNDIECNAAQTFTAQCNFYTKDKSKIDGSGVSLDIWFYNASGGIVDNFTSNVTFVDNEWVYKEITATAPTNSAYVAIVISANRNGEFWIAQPKIEEGNISTPWCLNPKDKVKQVRFWAGSSYEKRESAPFIVYNDGSIKATQGEYSGLWTGDIKIGNISIVDKSEVSGNDAILTIQNGANGIKKVRLTDSSSSIFAQDLIVSNNTYSPMVTLKQDGTALFDRGINIGDSKNDTNNVTLNKTSLIMSNKELTTTSTGFLVNSSLDVGSNNNVANLTVHGNTVSDSVTLSNELNFGGVIKFTKMSNGINIDFIK